jgi:hypothetical protein
MWRSEAEVIEEFKKYSVEAVLVAFDIECHGLNSRQKLLPTFTAFLVLP